MKTFRNLTAFIMTFLFASAIAVAAGNTSTKESAGQYIEDTAITTAVKSKIFAERTLSAAEINVETYKGNVQLSGFVSDAADIKRAEEVARTVDGVTAVTNSIKLKK